jgi:hypothetical protein
MTILEIKSDETHSFIQANYSPNVMAAMIDMLGFSEFMEGVQRKMAKAEQARIAHDNANFFPELV